jgi:hypothetical protein
MASFIDGITASRHHSITASQLHGITASRHHSITEMTFRQPVRSSLFLSKVDEVARRWFPINASAQLAQARQFGSLWPWEIFQLLGDATGRAISRIED